MATKEEKNTAAASTTSKPGEPELLAKMNVKAMGLDAKEARKMEKKLFLCRIVGIATEIKVKEDRNGRAYSYVIGDFFAQTKDDKKFTSSQLFLPGIQLQERIESELKKADGRPVEFGYDIYSQPDNTVAIGYRYAMQPIIAEATNDRMTALIQQASTKTLPK